MGRKPLHNKKRSHILGVKVSPEIFAKLQYLANREGTSVSSFVNELLLNHVDYCFHVARIQWPPESDS